MAQDDKVDAIAHVANSIDARFGAGFARANPTLVGQIVGALLVNEGLAELARTYSRGPQDPLMVADDKDRITGDAAQRD